MKCPYPDCQGDVTDDDAFCGECGRSLAPDAVASFIAGQKIVRPPVPQPKPNRTPLILGGVAGAVLLLLVVSVSLIMSAANKPTPTPTVPAPTATIIAATDTPAAPTDTPAPTATMVPPTAASELVPETYSFKIGDLNSANKFTTVQDIRNAAGEKLGLLTFTANYQYKDAGSPELMGTVQLSVNNTVVLELAASSQPLYAESNAGFEVAQTGHTYERVSKEGWLIDTAVDEAKIDETPVLASGKTGTQPAFTTLSLRVNITTGAAGKALRPTPEPPALTASYNFSLGDLAKDNNFTVNRDLTGQIGEHFGLVTFDSNYNYSTQGAPELIGSVELRVNNRVVLELAASDQPTYAGTNPAFEVPQAGMTYERVTSEGWTLTVTVNRFETNDKPKLPDGSIGNQPSFAALELSVQLSTSPLQATPTPEAFTLTKDFNLTQLNAANKWTAIEDLRTDSGRKLGVLSVDTNYNYGSQDAPELIGTVEIRINSEVGLELAASNQPLYAETNPGFEVAEANKTYVKTTKAGWKVTVEVHEVATDAKPKLPDGTAGTQPIFTNLSFTVTVDAPTE